MTFEEMVKDGRKFTANDYNVEIVNTNYFIGKANVMCGIVHPEHQNGYLLFNKIDGRCVSRDGSYKKHTLWDLIPIEE